MRILLFPLLGAFGAASVLGLGCGGDDPEPSSPSGGIEPADLLAEEVLHARWDCACQAADGEPATEPVAASSPCVAPLVPAARRACEQEILEDNWDEVSSIGTCRRNGYRSFIACVQDEDTACDLEFCYLALSDDLDQCRDFPADVETELMTCNS